MTKSDDPAVSGQGYGQTARDYKCQAIQLEKTIQIFFCFFLSVVLVYISERAQAFLSVWACVDPQGLSGHTHKCAFIK